MTSPVRRHREKEEMRQLILEAAKSIFLEKGFHSTTLRNIAEWIKYSPGTIYLYFKDKDEIFHALHESAFRKLLEQMSPLVHVEDPMERLIAMGRVYMAFARQNKDLYELMFILDAPINSMKDKDKWEMGARTLDLLKQVLRDCQERGHFQGMDVEYLSFMIWSSMHGMCALYCSGRCQAYDDVDDDELVEKGTGYLISMIRKF